VIHAISISRRAKKDLGKCPTHIVQSFMTWVGAVQLEGLERIRRLPGYHDEPLLGEWKGHRSVRLSRSYRAIYVIRHDDSIEFVLVENISKHEY
jgi:toxin HigB-1